MENLLDTRIYAIVEKHKIRNSVYIISIASQKETLSQFFCKLKEEGKEVYLGEIYFTNDKWYFESEDKLFSSDNELTQEFIFYF